MLDNLYVGICEQLFLVRGSFVPSLRILPSISEVNCEKRLISTVTIAEDFDNALPLLLKVRAAFLPRFDKFVPVHGSNICITFGYVRKCSCLRATVSTYT